MMSLIDTHAHLQFKSYDQDRVEVAKINSEKLETIINVGTSLDASEKGIDLSKKYSNFYASIAVHPHHVDQWSNKTYDDLKILGKNKKVVAVGEIGLDKHMYKPLGILRSDELKVYPKPDLKKQATVLDNQIQLALALNKPIIFHCREAYDELYEQIRTYRGKLGGLMHCFMGDWNQAKKFLNMNLYISFSGNITYKGNNYIREIAKKVPGARILSETDSPFLSPEPRRGKRNEPLYVKIVVSTIANLKGWSLESAAHITTKNAKELFNFQK